MSQIDVILTYTTYHFINSLASDSLKKEVQLFDHSVTTMLDAFPHQGFKVNEVLGQLEYG